MNQWQRATLVLIAICFAVPVDAQEVNPATARQLVATYCFDCHDDSSNESGLDLTAKLEAREFDRSLVFENLITAKMPPADVEQPTAAEKQIILKWLAANQKETPPNSFRRRSRHEVVHSINDLLGTSLNLADEIPEDRGTSNFDSDRRIRLSKEMLGAYFTVADRMLDHVFPHDGFPPEQIWVTNKLKDSHPTYNIYVRDYDDGVLFSWTRANNGNSYSFFYDHFDPPSAGWYELTFEAMKIGEFEEDVSIQIHAGKYYYADDRPQPQRLLDVISLGNRKLKPHTVRVFLNPGENVSVHCYSKHTFRKKAPRQGAYIKQLKVRGPLQDRWPPTSFQTVFPGLPIDAPQRKTSNAAGFQSNLENIGGSLAIGSFQPGMDKENMQDDRSLASIGKLDVVEAVDDELPITKVSVVTNSPHDLKQVIRRFAERAFSTNLSDAELEPYFRVGIESLQEQGDFVQAAKLAFKAIICSPRFLMTPGEHSNQSYSKAADLARILWRSVPDDELLRLSKTDQLSGQILAEQIDRMLGDARSRRMIDSFCDQWLNLRTWRKVSPSLKLYPHYDDLLDYYLPLETRAYVSHLIHENLPVANLIDSDFSFLNQRLAQHYGIAGIIGQQMRKVSFPPEVPRGGLLTMGSVLKVTTDGFETSPILRGAWISRNIVGTPLSPPPENVKAIEPAHGEQAATLREQIEQHKTNAACYACHKSIDPYGFALENFDATGAWRTKYRVENPHRGTFQFRLSGYYHLANGVDASGEIEHGPFEDVFGLKKILLTDHRKIAYNFAKTFFEYANGYQPNLKQRLALFKMLEDQPSDCRMKDLVTHILIYSLTGEPR